MTEAKRTGIRMPHGLQRMLGRDRGEAHRASTPLELLYDLTVVVAIALAGSQLAHSIVSGHLWSGVLSFAFIMFAVVWAWLSYSWFASAFDTDDWFMRLGTLVQMIGVLIIGLGVDQLFRGFEHGVMNNRLLVAGYVVMRISLVAMWVRVARESPTYRGKALTYIKVIVVAQLGWTALAVANPPLPWVIPLAFLLYAVELGGARMCEMRWGGTTGTPWHPHHIAERYSLLVIITLGEVILGTTTAIDAVTTAQGWSVQAVIVAVAGVSLAMGIWWGYFAVPMGEILSLRPDRGFRFGWGHLPLFAFIAATGAGLHAAASFVEGASELDETATVLVVAVPVALVILTLFGIVHLLLPNREPFHVLLLVLTVLTLAGAVGLAVVGVGIGWCLLVVMLAPWITVVGYETLGHQHLAQGVGALTPPTQA